jgi:hypothetical protein
MTSTPISHTTSRELLESVAGKAHELHSVVGCRKFATSITLVCSCGEKFRVPNSAVALAALRFVPDAP